MKRLEFLRGKFNVIPQDQFIKKFLDNPAYEPHWEGIETGSFVYYKYVDEESDKVYLSEDTFNLIVDTDPTKNKMYTQWLLNIINNAPESFLVRFLTEDLDKTRDDLILFDSNKRKKKFKEMAAKNYATKNFSDPTNINQYTKLQELSSVVYPFKKIQNISELEGQLEYMVELGEARMPVKDEQFTIFIPKTLRASELFNFTSWCTARKGNTMFKYYTKKPTPLGDESELIIVIDNGFFKQENEDLWQIHFETNQIMNKLDGRFDGMGEEVLPKNIAVRNFFYEYLGELLRAELNKYLSEGMSQMSFTNSNSKYLKHVLNFGLGELLFEVMDKDCTSISYEGVTIPTIPSLDKFKNLRTIYLDSVSLQELTEDNFVSENLEMVSIPRNKITQLPKSIGNCKKLKFINLLGNPIDDLPDSIQYLDPSKGGSLFKMNLPKSFENRERVAALLPTVVVGYN
jgi:hypothetical protein